MVSRISDQDLKSDEKYDVCVVGSGPAGISVADTLAGKGHKVCILESGSTRRTDIGESLNKVIDEGIEIEQFSLERILGGASTTWAGLSAPLDEVDFEDRDWIKYSGWPIDRKELIQYYKRASKRYNLPSWEWFDNPTEYVKNEFVDVPNWDRIEEKPFIGPTNPPNFGENAKYLSENSNFIDLFIEATVTHLEGDPNTGEVHHAVVRDYNNNQIKFKASTFVLACGGIGNPRLLLNSKFADEKGLGNDEDQVGRYLMNHPKANFGYIKLNKSVKNLQYVYGSTQFGGEHSGYFGLKTNYTQQKERGVLNSYIRLKPEYPWSMFFGSVDESFKMMNDMLSNFNRIHSKVLNIIYNVYKTIGSGAKKVGVYKVRNFMEMEPDPSNRVTLSDTSDRFGVPLPHVNHSPTQLDKQSMIALHDALENDLEESEWGTLASKLTEDDDPWPIDLDAAHYMGTTRMGTDVTKSVVNENCRLHFSPNTYIAGSSVFSTSGTANPTYTILALGIRLGEHLDSEL